MASEYEIKRDNERWAFDIYWYERLQKLATPNDLVEKKLSEIEAKYPHAKLTRTVAHGK